MDNCGVCKKDFDGRKTNTRNKKIRDILADKGINTICPNCLSKSRTKKERKR